MKASLRHLIVVATAAATVTVTACGGSEPTAMETGTNRVGTTAARGPGLWKLADTDTTIYLFGTFQVLPKGTVWRTPEFDRVVAQADSLVVEIERDDAMVTALFEELAVTPGLPPVVERVPKDKRPALEALIARAGAPPTGFDALETWAVGLALTATVIQDAGFGEADGVESQLEREFTRADKPIEGLETARQQLGFFDRLPEQSQRALLVEALDDGGPALLTTMLDRWTSGDADALAETLNSEFEGHPELFDALITNRNARWAEWLNTRLDSPGTVLVAVGAGHLAGASSVQASLAAKGLTVTRVQ